MGLPSVCGLVMYAIRILPCIHDESYRHVIYIWINLFTIKWKVSVCTLLSRLHFEVDILYNSPYHVFERGFIGMKRKWIFNGMDEPVNNPTNFSS